MSATFGLRVALSKMFQGKVGGIAVNQFVKCRTCRSTVSQENTNGLCKTCSKSTCKNCYRICDRCYEIFCMYHVETKIILRQQKSFFHKLCEICSEVWQ